LSPPSSDHRLGNVIVAHDRPLTLNPGLIRRVEREQVARGSERAKLSQRRRVDALSPIFGAQKPSGREVNICSDIAWKICLLGHVAKCNGRFTFSVNRRVTYKLYLTAAQERELWQCHKPHCAARQHQRGCGFVATRDQAAALSTLVDGLELLDRQPAWAAALETPSRAA